MKVERIKFKVNDRYLTSELYWEESSRKLPAIFITPGLHGFQLVEKMVARSLARAGYAVYITSFMPKEKIQISIRDHMVHDRAYELSVLGMRELIRLASEDPRIDETRLGLFGMSLGGIFTALNARLHPTVKASVIVAGGGGNGVILARSENPLIRYMRDTRMGLFKLKNIEEYEALIDRSIRWDALKVEGEVPTDRILMFISTTDTHVPVKAQIDTWKIFGKPEAKFSKLSHYSLILSIPFLHMNRIKRFYETRFADAV